MTALVETGDHPVLLFDGVCNFCNGSVLFVIRRDQQGLFHFASLQSTVGQHLLESYSVDADPVSTLVLIQGGRAYIKSSAVLRVALHLGLGWRILGALGLLVPRFLRDAAYSVLVKYRYRWFGKSDVCMVPTPELRERFLGKA